MATSSGEEQEEEGPSGACCICLEPLRQEQAHLEACLHSFHTHVGRASPECGRPESAYSLQEFLPAQCLDEWTAAQRRHPPQRGPALTCPLCKRAYGAVLYEFSGSQVQRRSLGGAAGAGGGGGPALSPDRQRRRARYFSGQGAAEPPPFAAAPPLPTAQQAARPEVCAWAQQELEAILLQPDLAIVAQHMCATLRRALALGPAAGAARSAPWPRKTVMGTGTAAAATTLARSTRGGGSSGSCSGLGEPAPTAEGVRRQVAAAAEPYVGRHAERFASELLCFAASGARLSAYDSGSRPAAGDTGRQRQAAQPQRPERGEEEAAQRGGGEEEEENAVGHDRQGGEGAGSQEEGGWYDDRSDSDGYADLLLRQVRARRGGGAQSGTEEDPRQGGEGGPGREEAKRQRQQ